MLTRMRHLPRGAKECPPGGQLQHCLTSESEMPARLCGGIQVCGQPLAILEHGANLAPTTSNRQSQPQETRANTDNFSHAQANIPIFGWPSRS